MSELLRAPLHLEQTKHHLLNDFVVIVRWLRHATLFWRVPVGREFYGRAESKKAHAV